MKAILLALSLTIPAYAQAPGVSIFDQSKNGLRSEESSIAKQAERLFEDGKLMGLDATKILIKTCLLYTSPSPRDRG